MSPLLVPSNVLVLPDKKKTVGKKKGGPQGALGQVIARLLRRGEVPQGHRVRHGPSEAQHRPSYEKVWTLHPPRRTRMRSVPSSQWERGVD